MQPILLHPCVWRRARDRFAAAALIALTTACSPPPLPVPEPIPAPDPPPFPHDTVWTRSPEVLLRSDSASFLIPLPFTRLEVLGGDTAIVQVQCESCPGAMEGEVSAADLVYEVLSPEVAAWGSLAEFALALRQAASRGDLTALRPVMSSDFSFSFVGLQARDEAIAAWQTEDLRTLSAVPRLLDQGLATRDSALWVAPPAHLQALHYRGPRLGLRRDPGGRWEWIFLLQSLRD